MFDAWTIAGVGGGAAALTFLAAGRKTEDGKNTLRLSLDKGGSLVGDVRLLGGGLAWLTSMYTSGDTKKTLQVVATASLLSLGMTELIRYRLAQQGGPVTIQQAKIFPEFMSQYGALPGPNAQYGNQHQGQGAWANR